MKRTFWIKNFLDSLQLVSSLESVEMYLLYAVHFHNMMRNNNNIKFNLIHVYLPANLTAQRPITKLVRVHRSTQNI
jgi:hypothetical protein